MSNAQDLETIEISIEDAKRSIERKNMLARLENNPDFKALIEEGFMKDHAVRQVMLKSHPGLQQEAQQTMLDQQITAIGGFKQFLVNVYSEGMNAEKALEEDEATQEELLKGDLDK